MYVKHSLEWKIHLKKSQCTLYMTVLINSEVLLIL